MNVTKNLAGYFASFMYHLPAFGLLFLLQRRRAIFQLFPPSEETIVAVSSALYVVRLCRAIKLGFSINLCLKQDEFNSAVLRCGGEWSLGIE